MYGRVFKPSVHRDGYLHVKLKNADRFCEVFVHRLVAMAFLARKDDSPEVDHIDGDKTNNAVDNLEWVSRKENMRRAAARGLLTYPDNRGERHGMAKLTAEAVREIRAAAGTTKTSALAKRFCVSTRTVRKILARETWKSVEN